MPAVRVTDAVSPLCSHVTGATSHQRAPGCMCVDTSKRGERRRGSLFVWGYSHWRTWEWVSVLWRWGGGLERIQVCMKLKLYIRHALAEGQRWESALYVVCTRHTWTFTVAKASRGDQEPQEKRGKVMIGVKWGTWGMKSGRTDCRAAVADKEANNHWAGVKERSRLFFCF